MGIRWKSSMNGMRSQRTHASKPPEPPPISSETRWQRQTPPTHLMQRNLMFLKNLWYLSKIWNSSLESCLLHSPSLAHSVNVSTKNRIARVVTPPESPSSRKRAWLQWGVVSSPAWIQRDLLHWPCLGLADDRGRKFMSFPNKSCGYARLCKAKYWAWAYTNAQVSVAKKLANFVGHPCRIVLKRHSTLDALYIISAFVRSTCSRVHFDPKLIHFVISRKHASTSGHLH